MNKTHRLQMRISDTTKEQLDHLCSLLNATQTQVVITIINDYFNQLAEPKEKQEAQPPKKERIPYDMDELTIDTSDVDPRDFE